MAKGNIPPLPGKKGQTKGKADKMPKENLPWDGEEDEVFEEDFTDVEMMGFKLVQEGFHHAKVVEIEKGESKQGNPQYIWEFVITAGADAGENIRYWTSLLPQARWKVVETLEAIGIEAQGSVAKFTKSDVVGRPCILEIVNDEYSADDGTTRTSNKIVKVHEPDEDTLQAAESIPNL